MEAGSPMLCNSLVSDLVRVAHVRAVSNGLVLICELPDRRRIGVPLDLIDDTSEVRRPGDQGTLVITKRLARDLGLDDPR